MVILGYWGCVEVFCCWGRVLRVDFRFVWLWISGVCLGYGYEYCVREILLLVVFVFYCICVG